MSGYRCSASFRSTSTRRPRSLMEPSFAHTRMRRAEKGDPTECSGTLSRRFFDQSPRDRRRERAAAPRHADARRAPRTDCGAGAARLRPWRCSDRRYRLRLERVPRRAQGARYQGCHQLEARANTSHPEGPQALPEAVPRRGVLSQPQTLSRHRHTLRQDTRELSRASPRRVHFVMAQLGTAPSATIRSLIRPVGE